MKQVCMVQGRVTVVDVPPPACGPRGVVVQNSHSIISTGTEIAMTGGGGGGSLVSRALANPQLVRKVLDKVSTIGVRQTLDLIRARQGSSWPLGYSAAGQVIEVGKDVEAFRVGDRVACGGAGYANHAEINFVPQNLVARVPDNLSYRDAAFATLAAIALQGVRRLSPTLGEQVVVVGLGLIGQLSVQLLRVAGCRVFGVDVIGARIDLARTLGLEDGTTPAARDIHAAVLEWTEGVGADGVVVCASAGDPALLNRAFDLCRPKGRLVLVGDVPIRISRETIYRKELDFFISCSYGPGRYDPQYEDRGLDYPLPYVRWTEGRNLAEALRLMSTGSLRVAELAQRTVPVDDAAAAYASLLEPDRPIAVVLEYKLDETRPLLAPRTVRLATSGRANGGRVALGVIGAGSFFRAVHLPNLQRHGGFYIKSVCARTGVVVHDLAARHQIPVVTTDAREIFADPEVQAVFIVTRHDLHAELVLDAVKWGKHVFVEKPMATSVADCAEIVRAVETAGVLLTVGFNRRFAPLARVAKTLTAEIHEPKTVIYRVNAGPLPANHWLRDPEEGGGRLVGEGVHFFDFVRWLLDAEPVSVSAQAINRGVSSGVDRDNVVAAVSFSDGSLGIVAYVSQGDTGLPKERVEIFGGGRAVVIDDFSALEVHGVSGRRSERKKVVDKGHYELLENFHDAVKGTDRLGVTATDGYWATWCAVESLGALRRGVSDAADPL